MSELDILELQSSSLALLRPIKATIMARFLRCRLGVRIGNWLTAPVRGLLRSILGPSNRV